MKTDEAGPPGSLLNVLLLQAGMVPLEPKQISKFDAYLSLFLRWNTLVNLSSVRDPEDILSRHFVESITCARALPAAVSTLLDFGSGGGLPGIPIALCRPDIAVTLAESQGKKAAFLQEAVRVLGISAQIFAGRAERLTQHFDCVVLRAVDKMPNAVRDAAKLVVPGGWLGLMSTPSDLPRLHESAGAEFSWSKLWSLPGSADRVFELGKRATNSPA